MNTYILIPISTQFRRTHFVKNFKLNQLEKVEYESDTLTVTYSVPHEYGTVTYTESFMWGPDYPPKELKRAAADFFQLLTDMVNSQVGATQTVSCGTCTGACCRNWEGGIRVTKEDVVRLLKGGHDPKEMVDLWDGGKWDQPLQVSVDGTIGMLKMIPWKCGKETACVNLDDEGCQVYHHRPTVCRNFPAINCGKYEEDKQKVDGLVQLRVKI